MHAHCSVRGPLVALQGAFQWALASAFERRRTRHKETAMSDSAGGMDDIATAMAEQAEKELAVADAMVSQRDLATKHAKLARDGTSAMLQKLKDAKKNYATDAIWQTWYSAFSGAAGQLAAPSYKHLQ